MIRLFLLLSLSVTAFAQAPAPDPANPMFLVTVRGTGYKLVI